MPPYDSQEFFDSNRIASPFGLYMDQQTENSNMQDNKEASANLLNLSCFDDTDGSNQLRDCPFPIHRDPYYIPYI